MSYRHVEAPRALSCLKWGQVGRPALRRKSRLYLLLALTVPDCARVIVCLLPRSSRAAVACNSDCVQQGTVSGTLSCRGPRGRCGKRGLRVQADAGAG